MIKPPKGNFAKVDYFLEALEHFFDCFRIFRTKMEKLNEKHGTNEQEQRNNIDSDPIPDNGSSSDLPDGSEKTDADR